MQKLGGLPSMGPIMEPPTEVDLAVAAGAF